MKLQAHAPDLAANSHEARERQRNAKRIFETATSRPVKTFPGRVLRGNLSRTLRYQTEQREKSLNLGESGTTLTQRHINTNLASYLQPRLVPGYAVLIWEHEAPRAVQTRFLRVWALDMSSSRPGRCRLAKCL